MLITFPDQEPIAVTLIDHPVPLPACVHDEVEIREHKSLAIVKCSACPYQALAVVQVSQ